MLYSAAIRGGLIEVAQPARHRDLARVYSAAIRGGLIEVRRARACLTKVDCIPPRFAAASLKFGVHIAHRRRQFCIPPRFAAASLK